MKLNIEDLLEAQRVRQEINSQNLESIEWYWKGEKIIIPKEEIDSWGYTGLSNTDFINFYDYAFTIGELK